MKTKIIVLEVRTTETNEDLARKERWYESARSITDGDETTVQQVCVMETQHAKG